MRRKWRWVWKVVAVTIVTVGVPGCGVRKTPLPAACQNGGCPPEVTSTYRDELIVNHDIDALFVIDDTAGLASRAQALAAGYQSAGHILAPRLENRPFAPSVHVAFVPGSHRSATEPAAPSRAAECGIVPPGQFLTTERCGRSSNSTRPFEEAFACMAALGSDSTGAFEPFAAIKRALGADLPAGFLRPNAHLLVVIVAGEDDASSLDAGPAVIADLVASLKSLKPYPDKVMVAVVGPPTDCPDAGASVPAPRLLELVQAFGSNGIYAVDCRDDALAAALERVTLWGVPLFEPGCIPNVFDTDLNAPGLQPDCVVEDRKVGVEGVERGEATVLPDCEHGAPPCWTLKHDACGPDEVLFDVDRGPDWCLQDGFSMTITCRACVGAKDPACRSY